MNLKLFYIMWHPSDKMVSVLLHVYIHQTVEDPKTNLTTLQILK